MMTSLRRRNPPLASQLGLLRTRIHWGVDTRGFSAIDYAVASGNRTLALALKREQKFGDSAVHEALAEVCGDGLAYLECAEDEQDTDFGMLGGWKPYLTGELTESESMRLYKMPPLDHLRVW